MKITPDALQQMATKEQLLDANEARRLFSYDEDTGLLTRKVTVSHNAKAGDIVGYMTTNGYLRTKIKGKHYRLHRVAFLIKEGRWPSLEIDHENHDKLNNQWRNIRECTRPENLANTRRKPNKYGYTGVVAYGKKFAAVIMHEGTKVRVGGAECPAEAAIAYMVLADMLHGVGAN